MGTAFPKSHVVMKDLVDVSKHFIHTCEAEEEEEYKGRQAQAYNVPMWMCSQESIVTFQSYQGCHGRKYDTELVLALETHSP